MSYEINSEDFLAICLYMVKGDISVPLSQLIETVEAFQKEKNLHYGSTDSDFRVVLALLCLEHHLIQEFPSETDFNRIFGGIQVEDIILPVLTKQSAFFNDSDTLWLPFEKGSRRLKPYDEIFKFFSSGLNKKPDEVIAFLAESSWSPSITSECLENSDYYSAIRGSDMDMDDFPASIE